VTPSRNIEDLLVEGQQIMVQVAKDPMGGKGARVTTHVSLPGRNLVLLPTMTQLGVSRRIVSEEERARLREILKRTRIQPYGWIARTASEGAKEEEIKAEMDFLVKLWESIKRNADRGPVPRLLYAELDITLRAVRDLMVGEVDKLIIDSPSEYRRILAFLDANLPRYNQKIQLYEGDEPIFDAFHIEMEISRALEKKIWLKSGGYILIEETEALTTIDVNSGRYVGKHNVEETILKINLEAAKEIAYQIRLRNLGGIIIIDFIDMEKESSRELVLQALKDALRKDRSPTTVLKMSELGLVQMTRKRVKEGVGKQLREPCPHCDGQGWVRSTATLCYEALREIQREIAHCGVLGGRCPRGGPPRGGPHALRGREIRLGGAGKEVPAEDLDQAQSQAPQGSGGGDHTLREAGGVPILEDSHSRAPRRISIKSSGMAMALSPPPSRTSTQILLSLPSATSLPSETVDIAWPSSRVLEPTSLREVRIWILS
jgi:ribonuclease G